MKLLRYSAILLLLVSVTLAAQSQSSSTTTEGSAVEYCDLIRNAASYHNKRVRVRAIYAVGFETSFLYKSECRGKGGDDNRVWVKFNSSFEKSSKAEVVKRFDDMLKPSPENPDGSIDILDARRAEVVFVGIFESDSPSDVYGHLGGYDYQITAESIEEVKPVSENAPW